MAAGARMRWCGRSEFSCHVVCWVVKFHAGSQTRSVQQEQSTQRYKVVGARPGSS